MTTYRDSGVDADAGDVLVDRIAPLARATTRPEVLAGVGGFGALFALGGRFQDPVLVSGTDGVGTKLKIAFLTGRHGTVGIDLVAMCVNDIATSGAEPLFFLDYFATGKLDVGVAEEVVRGIAEGCKLAGCALVGGETAELPGFYAEGEYDLAGFAVGCVERSRILDGSRIRPGDRVVGLGSSGLHSNGYSLVRRALLETARLPLDRDPGGLSRTLADELLAPTTIYARQLLALAAKVDLRGAAHITGGGIPGNLPRILPAGTRAVLRAASWPRPAIFDLVARAGGVAPDEMARTFNLGLGMCLVVPAADGARTVEAARGLGLSAWEVGEILAGESEPTAELV